MNQKQYFKFLFGTGILFAITGAILMFFGLFPISLRIILEIIGISLSANSCNISKAKKT